MYLLTWAGRMVNDTASFVLSDTQLPAVLDDVAIY